LVKDAKDRSPDGILAKKKVYRGKVGSFLSKFKKAETRIFFPL
jgi:hypothetical protein